MKFTTKKYAEYMEIIVEDRYTKMESGLLDDSERRTLAEDLRVLIDELLAGIKEEV